MAPINVPMLLSILETMTENELALAEFYQACSKFSQKDMENSVLESRYFEVVKSRDLEFLDLSSAIMKETVDHRETLTKKIGTLK